MYRNKYVLKKGDDCVDEWQSTHLSQTVVHEVTNLLKPNGFFTYHQVFNIQKFYIVLALRSVFCTYLRTDSDCCFVHH